MTYDGYIADDNNGLDWAMTSPEMDVGSALIDSWDGAIIGYNGYKEMAAYWPTAAEDDALSDAGKVFATKYNAMKKYVFSDKEHKLGWNNCELVLISDDASIIEAVTKLKQQPGKDIVVYGGVRIAQTLARLDLIDEYMPVIHPIVLGSGKPLFENLDQRLKLELVDVKQNKDGAVRIHYRRAK